MNANVWKKCNLGKITDIIMGQSPSTESYNDRYGIPLVQGNADIKNRHTVINSYTTSVTKHGIPGDIIFTVRAPVGNVAKNSFDCCLGRGVCAFRNANDYLFHYLISIENSWWKYSTGSTFDSVNASILQKAIVYLPKEISEQKHISDILSACDTVIQNTQKTIEKYKAIKQGMMQDLFTRGLTKDGKLRPSYEEAPDLYKQSELGMIPKEWEVKELNEVYAKVTNAFVGTATPYYVESGHFYLESNNVKNGAINFNNKIFINDYFYEKQRNNWLHTGDLVMVQSGHVGHTAVIPEYLNNTAAHAVIIIANSKIEASPYFYNYYFLSENAVNMISKITKGNTIKHILSSEMKNFKINYPQIDEQIAIAKRLSSIDSTIQKEEAILAKYKNIKTGLMARLLTPPEDAQIIDETEE